MNPLNILDIVKAAGLNGVYVVTGVDNHEGEITIELINELGEIHHVPRHQVYKTGHSVDSLLDKVGYITKPNMLAAIPVEVAYPDGPPKRKEPMGVQDPEVAAMIAEMERKMQYDANQAAMDSLLDELAALKSDGASDDEIEPVIRQLELMTEQTE